MKHFNSVIWFNKNPWNISRLQACELYNTSIYSNNNIYFLIKYLKVLKLFQENFER